MLRLLEVSSRGRGFRGRIGTFKRRTVVMGHKMGIEKGEN